MGHYVDILCEANVITSAPMKEKRWKDRKSYTRGRKVLILKMEGSWAKIAGGLKQEKVREQIFP